MASTVDRRAFLRATVLAMAAPAVAGVGDGPALAATGPAVGPSAAPAPVPAWTVRPFALRDVALGDGIFAAKRDLMLEYGRGYRVDRLLQVFRANAGLSTLGAVAPGGWEGLDGEANGNLRGHYTGHFLTMLAQAYAGTGEAVFAAKIDAIVTALVEVREALRRDPVVLNVPGRFGTATENVRGSHRYVELPPAVLGDAAAITLSAWVRPTHAANWARVFDFGNDTSRYLYLATRNAAGVPRFAITTGGPAREQAGCGGCSPAASSAASWKPSVTCTRSPAGPSTWRWRDCSTWTG